MSRPSRRRWEVALDKQFAAYFTISDARAYSGLSRTRLYENLHLLEVRKVGKRTLISRASLDEYLNSLPLSPLGRQSTRSGGE